MKVLRHHGLDILPSKVQYAIVLRFQCSPTSLLVVTTVAEQTIDGTDIHRKPCYHKLHIPPS